MIHTLLFLFKLHNVWHGLNLLMEISEINRFSCHCLINSVELCGSKLSRKQIKNLGWVRRSDSLYSLDGFIHNFVVVESQLWNLADGSPLCIIVLLQVLGDTYYIYATTDGTGNGYGPAQVWMSKDFVNWRNVLLNWPTTEVVWAPDVVQQPDGSYRYYYCTPCEVRVGESNSPTGPWTNRLGASDAVLVPDRFVHNAITLDPQLFRDDDGSEYLYFGTWGIYKDFGCGVTCKNWV